MLAYSDYMPRFVDLISALGARGEWLHFIFQEQLLDWLWGLLGPSSSFWAGVISISETSVSGNLVSLTQDQQSQKALLMRCSPPRSRLTLTRPSLPATGSQGPPGEEFGVLTNWQLDRPSTPFPLTLDKLFIFLSVVPH